MGKHDAGKKREIKEVNYEEKIVNGRSWRKGQIGKPCESERSISRKTEVKTIVKKKERWRQ